MRAAPESATCSRADRRIDALSDRRQQRHPRRALPLRDLPYVSRVPPALSFAPGGLRLRVISLDRRGGRARGLSSIGRGRQCSHTGITGAWCFCLIRRAGGSESRRVCPDADEIGTMASSATASSRCSLKRPPGRVFGGQEHTRFSSSRLDHENRSQSAILGPA